MRVVLHHITHDALHFGAGSLYTVLLHRMHNTTLYRLQAIVDVGHSTLEDYIRSVVQEPILVHTRKFPHALLAHQTVILTLRTL